MEVAEDFICSIVERVLADHHDELIELGRNIDDLKAVKKPFKRLTYSRAAELLKGPKAHALLESDLAEKTARVQELNKSVEELEALSSAQGVKQWKKDKSCGGRDRRS